MRYAFATNDLYMSVLAATLVYLALGCLPAGAAPDSCNLTCEEFARKFARCSKGPDCQDLVGLVCMHPSAFPAIKSNRDAVAELNRDCISAETSIAPIRDTLTIRISALALLQHFEEVGKIWASTFSNCSQSEESASVCIASLTNLEATTRSFTHSMSVIRQRAPHDPIVARAASDFTALLDRITVAIASHFPKQP